MINQVRRLLCFLAVLVTICGPAYGDNDYSGLQSRLAELAKSTPGNSVVGICVQDVVTGKVLFERNADKLFNPASNTKVVTAAAALAILGPDYQFETQLYGKVSGNSVVGPLYIKGHADPTLTVGDLANMVLELKADGVVRVGGGIVVDDTFFDNENLPYAYDQQPNEDNKFRAPVGAVSLEKNAMAITIRPGRQAMDKARVTTTAPGYGVLVNDTLTTAGGAASPRISSTTQDDHSRIRVWGNIPLGTRTVTYYRRIDNPSLFTGYGLKRVLRDMGFSVAGDVRRGSVPKGTPLLAVHRSAPLSSVLWETGKFSNNFVTETVMKTIGTVSHSGPGTWSAATDAVAKQLSKWGIKEGKYQYRNGSGLFDANRFSPRQFCQVLRATYLDSTIRPEFLAQLATGGVDGTIASRYRGSRVRAKVRAKTGTLDAVSALSGYVMDSKGLHPVVFSILVNKASGYVSAARSYQEKLVTAIAERLNP